MRLHKKGARIINNLIEVIRGSSLRSLACLFFLGISALPCMATTFTVNSTADTDNGLGDNVPAGSNTLRKCIRLVNASATGVTHNIHFNLSGNSPYVITLTATLPEITQSVNINVTGCISNCL